MSKKSKNNFFTRRALNIDITHRCPLDCPRCQRWKNFRRYGKKVPGTDISISQMKKIISFYNNLNFCGQLSDPVHHPKFIEILKLLLDNNITCSVRNASSAKSKDWYIKAFKSNPKARWVFGIDGLPNESHVYRINQDGKKLFDIMIEAKKYLITKPIWQYIIFRYNENHVEQAKQMAKDNDIPILIINSSKWWGNKDPYRPTNPELSFDPNIGIIKKLIPKCFGDTSLNVGDGSISAAITNRGYLLPCCYCDQPSVLASPEIKKIMKVSKIDDVNSIEKILSSDEWLEFTNKLENNKGPTVCWHLCGQVKKEQKRETKFYRKKISNFDFQKIQNSKKKLI